MYTEIWTVGLAPKYHKCEHTVAWCSWCKYGSLPITVSSAAIVRESHIGTLLWVGCHRTFHLKQTHAKAFTETALRCVLYVKVRSNAIDDMRAFEKFRLSLMECIIVNKYCSEGMKDFDLSVCPECSYFLVLYRDIGALVQYVDVFSTFLLRLVLEDSIEPWIFGCKVLWGHWACGKCRLPTSKWETVIRGGIVLWPGIRITSSQYHCGLLLRSKEH